MENRCSLRICICIWPPGRLLLGTLGNWIDRRIWKSSAWCFNSEKIHDVTQFVMMGKMLSQYVELDIYGIQLNYLPSHFFGSKSPSFSWRILHVSLLKLTLSCLQRPAAGRGQWTPRWRRSVNYFPNMKMKTSSEKEEPSPDIIMNLIFTLCNVWCV